MNVFQFFCRARRPAPNATLEQLAVNGKVAWQGSLPIKQGDEVLFHQVAEGVWIPIITPRKEQD